MGYPKDLELNKLADLLKEYGNLMHEYGAEGVEGVLESAKARLTASVEAMKALPIDSALAAREPDELSAIRRLRPDGARRMWKALDSSYMDKLEGAMLSRFAGCTLGAPVELWSIEAMADWAKYIGFGFPPRDYWPRIKSPNDLRYGVSPCEAYTSEKMCCVPVDDDVTYTVLGLLIAEDYGVDFTVEDVGKAWLRYLPYACTAEEVALRNLKNGVEARRAADMDNPFCQWIGADIRSDPWAYMAPAWPEKAAGLAYRDATLSHRRNGIYGEMFFAAAQSAAFAVDNAEDALRIGLSEIPKDCALHRDVSWALSEAKHIHNYREARDAMDERFKGMHAVHTNNNAALTVWGLTIGGNDVTKVISETVAMGMDNDCTAATAGSIVGAIVGKKGVPSHWYDKFNNTVLTYLTGSEHHRIDDLAARFAAQAARIYQ